MGAQNGSTTTSTKPEDLKYQSEHHLPSISLFLLADMSFLDGFGNWQESEAVPGSIPERGYAPQKVPHDLYTECLSGTAFTVPRDHNQRAWLYRLQPSAGHEPFVPYKGHESIVSSFYHFLPEIEPTPQQLRWDPLTVKGAKDKNFIDGIRTIGGAGDPQMKDGLAIHCYNFGKNMGNTSLYNSDGDYLIVPVTGDLLVTTEFGKLHVPSKFFCVVQRGIKFKVDVVEGTSEDGLAQGFILEIYKGHFVIPELGPIGSNGLANAKDFQTPVAYYEDNDEEHIVVNKFSGKFFQFKQNRSPFDVVAFSGNYIPYRYDLRKFNVMGSVSYDHPDPSIHTVLTCVSDVPGVAVADFVVFAPRWMVMEDTFRPPWFHRNVMSEFMGNICGTYDAKAEGFMPGGASLHNMNTPHGPDADTYKKATTADLKPHKLSDDSYAFMFETCYQVATTKWAVSECGKVQPDYYKAWAGLERISTIPRP